MKKEIFGYSRSHCGTNIYIDSPDNKEIIVDFKDFKESCDFYCKPLKITIETIGEDELNEKIEEFRKNIKNT